MTLKLEHVDKAEVIILSDNYCEQVILSSDMVFRPGGLTVMPGEEEVQLKAEHAFAAAVRLYQGEDVRTVLLDTGRSGEVVLNNAGWVGLDWDTLDAIVISHGHHDHAGGLSAIAEKLNHQVPVIVHPDAFQERYLQQANGGKMRFPDFNPQMYEGTNLDFQPNREPILLAGNRAIASGEIPRNTEYEKGFAPQLSVRNGELVPDVEIWDDQSLVFMVKDRGPVIISGCGHSGIVNSAQYGMRLTGSDFPLAVIGGFHLCWPTPKTVVDSTVTDIKRLGTKYVVPCHCTGWEANHQFAMEMPEEFILSTVGCTITF